MIYNQGKLHKIYKSLFTMKLTKDNNYKYCIYNYVIIIYDTSVNKSINKNKTYLISIFEMPGKIQYSIKNIFDKFPIFDEHLVSKFSNYKNNVFSIEELSKFIYCFQKIKKLNKIKCFV